MRRRAGLTGKPFALTEAFTSLPTAVAVFGRGARDGLTGHGQATEEHEKDSKDFAHSRMLSGHALTRSGGSDAPGRLVGHQARGALTAVSH